MDNYIKNLNIKTSYISSINLIELPKHGYVPIFICRYLSNPLVKSYENSVIHMKCLSPSSSLLYEVKNNKITWDEYKCRYIDEINELQLDEILLKFYSIIDMSNAKGAVLMCYEKNPDKCHRSILSNYLNSLNILNNKIKELVI